MDEPTEIQSTFPAPPAHYLRYTNANLQLLAQLKDKLGPDSPSYHPASTDAPYPDVQAIRQQHALLTGAHDVPDWDLLELQRPRVDWIVEEGGYSTFGQEWQIPDQQTTVEQLGVQQLYPPDPNVDRRPYLQQLLHTILHNHFEMLGALLEAPVMPNQAEENPVPSWERFTKWTEAAAVNMIMAVNDLRSLQARATLEGMMEMQVRNRRDDARMINEKCDAIEAMLDGLKQQSLHYKSLESEGEEPKDSNTEQKAKTSTDIQILTQDDLMAWAEEVIGRPNMA
ncbi:mediator complex subunit Med7 [Ceratobasidium sp. AG-Ba]|nr:mediator complex subunit Med7 [Ceratobasidium sp. AG-Ba]QRW15066.1 mediator complex subunit Med7 [Ceratobasidium sp. AG-Ba]